MRIAAAGRRGVAAVVSLCVLTTVLTGVLATRPADAAPCRYRINPVPAVDTSEVPKPGDESPAPLPVPDAPAGGERMGECGVVLPENAPRPPSGTGFKSWQITDLDSGAVLAAKDPHGRQRPASLAKILLGLLVAREVDPNTVVTGTQAAANQEGSSAGIGKGGRYTVDQLLHGLLMVSGNDVAYLLAEHLGGVGPALRRMNELARRLGTTDTRIVSPSGLDGPGMSTSAYDLSLLFRAAMNTPRFAKAVGTEQYRFPGFQKNRKTRKPYLIYNDNDLLTTYAGDLGGKTGFTDDAQNTFANAAQRGGRRIGLVMMYGDSQTTDTYDSARVLMDYGFRLAATGTEPVGEIVAEQRKPAPKRDAAQVRERENDRDAAAPAAGQGSPALLWIVGGLLVLAVLGVVLIRSLRGRER